MTTTPSHEGHSRDYIQCVCCTRSNTYAEACTLPQMYCHTHASQCPQYLRVPHPMIKGRMRPCACVRSRVYTFACTPVFPRFLSARRCAAQFDCALLQTDLDAARDPRVAALHGTALHRRFPSLIAVHHARSSSIVTLLVLRSFICI